MAMLSSNNLLSIPPSCVVSASSRSLSFPPPPPFFPIFSVFDSPLGFCVQVRGPERGRKKVKRAKLYYLRDRAPKESTVVFNEADLNLPTTP